MDLDFIFLQNDMMKYFREDLHRRLLSTDFKKQVDGLEMLQKVWCSHSCHLSSLQIINILTYNSFYLQALPSIRKDIIEVLDILLRWFVLQFCKSNTTCLLKVYLVSCFRGFLLFSSSSAFTNGEKALFIPRISCNSLFRPYFLNNIPKHPSANSPLV